MSDRTPARRSGGGIERSSGSGGSNRPAVRDSLLPAPECQLKRVESCFALGKYLIERRLPGVGKQTPADLTAAAAKSNQVLRTLGTGVQWLNS